MSMVERRLKCLWQKGFYEVSYAEWPGPPGAPTILCVHGLTRNGRDFDYVAEALSAHFRVICPDMPGRRNSQWLHSSDGYNYALYLATLAALIARLGVDEVYWLGTSMGGILGFMMAAIPDTPVRRLVVNDIGPLIAKEGIERIVTYTGLDQSFRNIAELEAKLRETAAGFGPLTDEEWRHLAANSVRQKADGSVGFAYDPTIADGLRKAPINDIELWDYWDCVRCPTLVLRGETSDVLRRADAEAMTRRGPRADLIEFPGVGHAPALMAPDQIAAVRDFFVG